MRIDPARRRGTRRTRASRRSGKKGERHARPGGKKAKRRQEGRKQAGRKNGKGTATSFPFIYFSFLIPLSFSSTVAVPRRGEFRVFSNAAYPKIRIQDLGRAAVSSDSCIPVHLSHALRRTERSSRLFTLEIHRCTAEGWNVSFGRERAIRRSIPPPRGSIKNRSYRSDNLRVSISNKRSVSYFSRPPLAGCTGGFVILFAGKKCTALTKAAFIAALSLPPSRLLFLSHSRFSRSFSTQTVTFNRLG